MHIPNHSSIAAPDLQPRGPFPRGSLFLLLLFLAGATAGWLGLAHLRAPLTFSSFQVPVENGAPVPVTRVRLQARAAYPVHFVLLPGYIANRSQLLHPAEVLAAAGGDVYVLDLPGRGDNAGVVSPRPPAGPTASMATPHETAAALAVVHHITGRFNVPRDALVVVGHSMGGGVALDMGRRILPAATVSLAGLERPVAPGIPPHPLFITARLDIPPLIRAADKMHTEAGSAAARRTVFAVHSTLPFHSPVQQNIVEWANRAVPGAGLRIPPYFNEKLLALELVALFFLAAAFLPLCALAGWALNVDPYGEVIPETRLSLWTAFRLAGYALLAGLTVVSVIALLRWLGAQTGGRMAGPLPLGFLGLEDGDYLASVLLLATLSLLPALRHRPWVREWRGTAAKMGAVFPLAAYLLVAGGGFLTWQLFDIWPTRSRLLCALLLMIVLFPYALGEELLVRAYSKRATDRGLSGLLLWRLGLLVAILFGAVVLHSGAGLLLLMTLPLILLTLLEYFFTAALYRSLASAYADAALKCILLGWFIATVFPWR